MRYCYINRVEDIQRQFLNWYLSQNLNERVQEMQNNLDKLCCRISYFIQQRRDKTSSYGKMLLLDASGRQAPAIPRMSFTLFLE